MKTVILSIAALAVTLTARADLSYTSTMNSTGPVAVGNGRVTKHFMKGQRMKVDYGDRSTIIDFDAQTITSINGSRKTYSVTKFSDVSETMKKADVEMKIDFKETGQHKKVNGYNAAEAIMTMDIDSPQARQSGVKMQMEMDMWLSSEVPGAREVRAFYQKNAGRFPWMALGGGAGNPSTQQAIAEMQRKLAGMDGLPVLQVMKMKSVGSAGNDAQMAKSQQAMAQARAKFEEMKKQGGQQAALAEQMLARMGAVSGGAVFETTTESSNFSTSPIPDAEFAIPAGYQKTDQK